jgi:hypothetical protein
LTGAEIKDVTCGALKLEKNIVLNKRNPNIMIIAATGVFLLILSRACCSSLNRKMAITILF